jgi:hypothetical protein
VLHPFDLPGTPTIFRSVVAEIGHGLWAASAKRTCRAKVERRMRCGGQDEQGDEVKVGRR